MPKIAAEMSALAVARIRGEGDHHVGGVPGLLLRVAGNSRVWVLRVRVGGGRVNLGLGPYPEVSLLKAREKARERRAGLDHGAPVTRAERRRVVAAEADRRVLFKTAATDMINARRVEWKNAKHAAQWTSTLETYAYPLIGDVPVDELTVQHILKVLEPIWYSKPETASRVRGRVEAAIDYAIVKHSLRMENPARWKGHLEVLLPAKRKVKKVKHHKAVPWGAAPGAVKVILGARGVAAKALMFTLLGACRSGEALGMRAGEILWDEALWVVPAERMKMPRDHYVPLTEPMLEILRAVGADAMGPEDLVFTSSQKSRKGEPLSDGALQQVMRKNGIDATPHGWRSTFKDWASEATEYANELSEMALAHTIANKAEAAYRRGDMLERRRPLMRDWARYLLSPGA